MNTYETLEQIKRSEEIADRQFHRELMGVSSAFSWIIVILMSIAIACSALGNYQDVQRLKSEPFQVISMKSRRFLIDDYGEVLVRFEDGTTSTVYVGMNTYADIAVSHQPCINSYGSV